MYAHPPTGARWDPVTRGDTVQRVLRRAKPTDRLEVCLYQSESCAEGKRQRRPFFTSYGAACTRNDEMRKQPSRNVQCASTVPRNSALQTRVSDPSEKFYLER